MCLEADRDSYRDVSCVLLMSLFSHSVCFLPFYLSDNKLINGAVPSPSTTTQHTFITISVIMARSFIRILRDIGMDKSQRERLANCHDIRSWKDLVASEEQLRKDRFQFVETEHAHKLYAAIWWAKERVGETSDSDFVIESFHFNGEFGFDAYYQKHFVDDDDGSLLIPYGNTSADESEGDLGLSGREHDLFDEQPDPPEKDSAVMAHIMARVAEKRANGAPRPPRRIKKEEGADDETGM
jgi:hypothetical protein